jgi:hypothetical protein
MPAQCRLLAVQASVTGAAEELITLGASGNGLLLLAIRACPVRGLRFAPRLARVHGIRKAQARGGNEVLLKSHENPKHRHKKVSGDASAPLLLGAAGVEHHPAIRVRYLQLRVSNAVRCYRVE